MNFYYINVNNELVFVAKNDNHLTIIDTEVEFGRDYITVIAA